MSHYAAMSQTTTFFAPDKAIIISKTALTEPKTTSKYVT